MILQFLSQKIPFLKILESNSQVPDPNLQIACYFSLFPSLFLIIVNTKCFFVSILIFLTYILVPGLLECAGTSVPDVFANNLKLELVIKKLSIANQAIFGKKIFFYLIFGFLGPKIFSNFLVPHIFFLEVFLKFGLINESEPKVSYPRIFVLGAYFFLVFSFFLVDYIWDALLIFSGAILFSFWFIYTNRYFEEAKKYPWTVFVSTAGLGFLFIFLNSFLKRKR